MLRVVLVAFILLLSSFELWAVEIPKNIHYVWLGEEMPDDRIDYVIQTVEKNPDYQVKLWTDNTSSETSKRLLKLKVIIQSIDDILNRMPTDQKHFTEMEMGKAKLPGTRPNYAAASDILRVYALDEEGGVYVDADAQPLQSLGSLDAPYGFMSLFGKTHTGRIGMTNGILASVPGHSILKKVKEAIGINYQDAILAANSEELFWKVKLTHQSMTFNSKAEEYSVENSDQVNKRFEMTVHMSGPDVVARGIEKYVMQLESKPRAEILITDPATEVVVTSSSGKIKISMKVLREKYRLLPNDNLDAMTSKLAEVQAKVIAFDFCIVGLLGFHFPQEKFDHKSDMSWVDSEGGKRKHETQKHFWSAIRSGDIDTVRKFLMFKDLNPSLPDQDGNTPLSIAEKAGHSELVKLLSMY